MLMQISITDLSHSTRTASQFSSGNKMTTQTVLTSLRNVQTKLSRSAWYTDSAKDFFYQTMQEIISLLRSGLPDQAQTFLQEHSTEALYGAIEHALCIEFAVETIAEVYEAWDCYMM
jgi:hypothetical protein